MQEFFIHFGIGRNKEREEDVAKWSMFNITCAITELIAPWKKRGREMETAKWVFDERKLQSCEGCDAMPVAQVADHDARLRHTNFKTNLLTQITERRLLDKWSQCLTLLFYLPWICGAFGL